MIGDPSILPDREEALPAGVRGPSAAVRAAVIGFAAFAAMLMLGLVISRHPFAFDRAIIASVHGRGPGWLRQAMVDVTALGGTTVLTLVVIAAVGLLVVRGVRITALLVVAATLSGSEAVRLLKALFARARPDIVDHVVTVSGASFPSGHSANSAIVYLTLAGLVTQVMRGRAARRYVLLVAVLTVAAIGASRVYLGVHWPSDVLAGWSFGTLWALGWWLGGARARQALVSGPRSTDA